MFLKVISFDIEALPYNSQMPVPDKSPILMITCVFNYDYNLVYEKDNENNKADINIQNNVDVQNNNGTNDKKDEIKTKKIALVLTKNKEDHYSNIFKYDIDKNKDRIELYFDDEKLMLEKFFELLKVCDVITGYNINNFDIPYIIDRAKTLGISDVRVGLSNKRLSYKKDIRKGFTVTKFWGLSGKIVFDVLSLLRRDDESNVFKKDYNLKVLTLKHVSKEILGIEEGKLEFSIEDMINYWNDSLTLSSNIKNAEYTKNIEYTEKIELRNRFIDYCIRDSEVPLILLTRFRLLDKIVRLSKRSGKVIQEVVNSMGSGRMVENLLLKDYKKEDRVMPCRGGYASEYKELKGAFVLEPKLGITNDCVSLDYQSLYPSLLIKHNLCYSTVVLDYLEMERLGKDNVIEHKFDNGDVYGTFVKKEIYTGIIPRLLEGLLDERAKLKAEMKKYEKGSSEYLMYNAAQQAIKILLNSFYGYTGDAKAKLYSWSVATAVTNNGRRQILRTIEMIEKEINIVKYNNREFKLKVIMGDTDSSYINVLVADNRVVSREEVMYCINEVVLKYVNDRLEKPMKLAFENYIKRIFIQAKKRYGMLVIDDNGKMNIINKGLENIRRDWCNMTADCIDNIVENLLVSKNINDGIDKSVLLVKDLGKNLKKDNIDKKLLVLSNKLTMPITSYDNKEAHVMVATKMKQRGVQCEIGDRIQYVIVDNKKKLVSERAEEAEFAIKNNLYLDIDYYINNQLIPPAMRILKLVGVEEELLRSGMDENQKSLMEWS